jgi:broad specificity phosphatase PhoE
MTASRTLVYLARHGQTTLNESGVLSVNELPAGT